MGNSTRATARKKPPQSDQPLLPGIRDFREERSLALHREIARVGELWDAGFADKKLHTAVMLVLCGLPIRDAKGKHSVVRKARLGDGSQIKVTFSRASDLVPLPFGADRTMLFFLTDKAFFNDTPSLRWEYVKEYMDLFGMDAGGGSYQQVQERFLRVSRLNIDVDHLDAAGKVLTNWKCPVIDSSRMAVTVDEDGKMRPSSSLAEILAAQEAVEFGLRFFRELKSRPIPIPFQILRAVGRQFRLMDYMVFLYWRAWAAQSVSFIPWRALKEQFDATDTNERRWASWFRRALIVFRSLPAPLNQIKARVTSEGIEVHPLPIGTEIFPGQPKLGMSRKKFAALQAQAKAEEERRKAEQPKLPSKEAAEKWAARNKYPWKKFLGELQLIRNASAGSLRPEGWEVRVVRIAASRADIPEEIALAAFGFTEADLVSQ